MSTPHPLSPARIERADSTPREPLRPVAADRLMVLAPHPDDEVLATGGLIQHACDVGAKVRVVYVTNGENNPWAQLVTEGRWPFTPLDRARWGARRRDEALAGLSCLGVPASAARFLGFPDQGLSDLFMRGESGPALALAAEIEAWRPTVIAAPAFSDPHPDHGAVALYLEEARARHAMRQPEPSRLSYSYTVHSPRPCSPADRVLVIPAEAQGRKRRAILCHVSQLRWRRDQFLELIRSDETFQFTCAATFEDPAQPMSECVLDGEVLRVRIARRLGPGFGPAVLWVALEDRERGPVRLAARLPVGTRRTRVRDELRGAFVGHATVHRSSRGIWLELPLAPLRRPRHGFVRLDRPFARRLGFIYGVGWHRVALADWAQNLSDRHSTADFTSASVAR